MIFGAVDVVGFAEGGFAEEQFADHSAGVAAPAERGGFVLRLDRDHDFFTGKSSPYGIGRFQRDQLVAQIAVSGRRTHDRPVFPRTAEQQIFAARLVDAVIVGVQQQGVFRTVDQPRRSLLHRLFQIVIDPAAGKEDIMVRMVQQLRQIKRDLRGRVGQIIHDRIVIMRKEFPQHRQLFGIALIIFHVGVGAFDFIQRNAVHLTAVFRQKRDHVTGHGAARAQDQNSFRFHGYSSC